MSRFTRILLVAVVLAALLLPNLPVGATRQGAAAANQTVRISASDAPLLASLGVQPVRQIDYNAYAWLELTAADAARLAGRIPLQEELDAGTLVVPNYRFDPLLEGEPSLPAGMKAGAEKAGFRLVQFAAPVRDAWLAQIQASGAVPLQYYPHNTYLVWATPAQEQQIAANPTVRWTGLFHPAYKINADLVGRLGVINNVGVFFYNDGDVDATLEAIRHLGGVLVNNFPAQPDKAFYNAIFTLDAAVIADVARLDAVLWLGYSHPEPVLDDEMSSQIVAGNYTAGVPYVGYQSWLSSVGVDGAGVIWAIVDTGVDYDHPDLGSHIVGGYDFPGACSYPGEPGSDCPSGGHGTHVAGIVGGDATGAYTDPNGFKYGLGVAPEYSIYAMNSLSAAAWPPAGGWQEHSKRAVLGSAVGGNNSWTTGEGTAHGYQASERTHDIMVLDGNFDTPSVAEPFIEVFSAGNSGPGAYTLTAPKEAKNLTIVASSVNYRAGSIDSISGFSSRGPAVDGRYVPTIATPGEQIASSRNDDGGSCSTPIGGTNNLYAYCSGTSMAAPHTSGAIALITDWWRGFNSGANPSSAMAKALLVNGAVDMGAADRPNFNEGWGRVHLGNVFDATTSVVYFDQDTLFQNVGETWTLGVGVVDASKPLKITLAWADAPGAIGANPALVNNLDLTVVNGASTYYGNHFGSGWSTPGGTPDAINNLENVFIQNPASNATITVQATNLPGDAVLYNGDPTDQVFALVCYNCGLAPDFELAADPAQQAICAPDPAAVSLSVNPFMGFSDPVTLSAAISPTAPMTTSFSANPVTPPGSSTLTVGNTGAAVEGSYTITVTGAAPTATHAVAVGLDVYAGIAASPALLSPPDAAPDQPLLPTFTWAGALLPVTYDIEIARDAAFTDIVQSAAGLTAPTFTSSVSLETAHRYYWRVRTNNLCGQGAYSAAFRFTTYIEPGDCPVDSIPMVVYQEDFDSGAPGWSHSGTQDTWDFSSTRVHSGAYSMHALNPSTPSDQMLVSPAFNLPAGLPQTTLQFWNYQRMEDRNGGCYDGGLLEVTTDGGANWTQVTSGLQTDPYDGPIASGLGNPLSGKNAWCGDPQDWLNSVIDLGAYAGETVQFRFRLGTDNAVSREGWYVDDVAVQSCIQAGYSAALTEDSLQSAYPGEVVTHTFSLQNLGYSDAYTLTLSGNAWAATLVTSPTISLSPGESAPVMVQVQIPAVIPEAVISRDVFTLTAASHADPATTPSVQGTTEAMADVALDLQVDRLTGTGAPGGMVEYTLQVTNTGSYTDTFTLQASGVWTATLSALTTAPLGSGESAAVTLQVAIPAGAAIGDSDLTTVTAVSDRDGSVASSVQVSTEAAMRWVFLPMLNKQP